ncbi:MAG: Nif3-like dinuclear metal center hexameric protein [Defluviitaleaceae bacterium]|nr:Nif3-like dinuclear metal center hexameric protein [Defluviitaleaceae bacterium]
MSIKLSQIIEIIENLAPVDIAEEWDNVGLLVGRREATVSKVLLALDALDAVIDEAIEIGADAIITHHPIIFRPISQITNETPLGCRLLKLIEGGICLYSAHTNLDATEGGLNDTLFDILGLSNKEFICESKPSVFAGRAGTLSMPISLSDFAIIVKNVLSLDVATYCGNGDDIVHKVGIISGGSANREFFRGALAAGCDTFITSDIKLDVAQAALDMKLNLIDATHYGSEVIFAEELAKYLRERVSGVEFVASKINGQVFKVAIGGKN